MQDSQQSTSSSGSRSQSDFARQALRRFAETPSLTASEGTSTSLKEDKHTLRHMGRQTPLGQISPRKLC